MKKTIDEIISQLTLDEIIALAEGTNDINVLTALSRYPNKAVRLSVVHNKNITLSILKKMQNVEHEWVMVWAVENEIDRRNKTYVKRRSSSVYDDDVYPTRTTVWDDDLYPPYR